MRPTQDAGLVALAALVVATGVVSACGGGGGGTSNSGFVQITDFDPNPQQANCASDNTAMPKNIGAPDSVMMEVQMINTTAADVPISGASTSGVIVVATDPADVGKSSAVFPVLPYTPDPAVLVAKTGDMTIRVAMPTAPICQTKPVGYNGQQDINVSVRMATPIGMRVTLPVTIRMSW
ncbi:MAG TPA: hypothetical protein VJR92_02460 [Gemmatimonadaceae bacterium]|nr:hypothetical protein [Gemmatimonadaceae bacterium]